MGLFNNDDEYRDRDGHLPDTVGRNVGAAIAALCIVAALILAVVVIVNAVALNSHP